jgi:aspartokinase-like uncharacterized kinase
LTEFDGVAKPAVVKFGGSLLTAPERDGLLAAAARRGAVVAPGGGPFADAVRASQTRFGFGAATAHRMAILAMDQTALMLADVAPALALCDRREDFAAAETAGRGALWRPSPIALEAELPASWDVTSDSLALWLAITLRADRLVLLKAAAASAAGGPSRWAEAGLVDARFPILAASFSGEITLLAPATAKGLDQALAAPLRRAA